MELDGLSIVIVAAFLAVVAWLGFGTLRHGSFSGLMFGARSAGPVGELEGRAKGHRRVTVAVHRLEDGGSQRAVGIHMTGKAFASVQRVAGSVSRDDARRLAELLESAAAEHGPA